MRHHGALAFLVIIAGHLSSVSAQTPVALQRIAGPITLDGRSDEPAWQAVEPLPLTLLRPVFRGTPTERTTMRVAYDEEHLYVAGEFYDSTPSGIRANSLYRDRYSNDDLLTVVLDPFNDNENALFFYITPAGVRIDAAVANDAIGSFRQIANFNWNTFWNAETIQNDDGWFVEARIPFSSIGFQSDGGSIVMGLIMYRFIARTNEVIGFPAIPPEWLWYQPSQGQDVLLDDVHSSRPIYVSPYVLGGMAQTPLQNTDGTAYHLDENFTQDIGLDVKYNINPNLTLDLTINTDFAQVEADDQQINLTRLSLFFPEKRPFFQERSSLLEFQTGFRDRLFHSRRIGLSARGEPIPILGGLRMVGRLGAWDVGMLTMQTARHQGIPSENFGVARLRRRVLNPYSYAGGIVTSRIDEEGQENVVYGLDGLIRITGNEYLTLQWGQTVADHRASFDFSRASMARVRWERRSQQDLSYFGDLTWYGTAFRPELGFIARRAFTQLSGEVAYGWLQSDASPLRIITPTLSAVLVLRNEDGTVESGDLEAAWPFTWKSGSSITPSLEFVVEDFREPLALPEGAEVPPGTYSFQQANVSYGPPFGPLLRTSLGVGIGTFYDGWSAELSASPTWNVSRFLELGGNYRATFVHFPDRDVSFSTHVGGLRVQAALNKQVSLNSFLQYNSAFDAVSANVRFRYNFREGNDLWIVYNEGLDLDRDRVTPILPLTSDRTVLLKYTHTFAL